MLQAIYTKGKYELEMNVRGQFQNICSNENSQENTYSLTDRLSMSNATENISF